MQEPRFIRDARLAIEQQAEGRTDAATYVEAGNAALNLVRGHYLTTPVLNPGLVADERAAQLREHYERQLQRLADSLAQMRRELAQLREMTSALDSETGLTLVEALRRARDQARSAQHGKEAAEAALRAGSPPIGRRAANARHERTREENLRLATRVRELEAQLK